MTFKSLSSELQDDEKYDTEIQRHMEITKVIFQNSNDLIHCLGLLLEEYIVYDNYCSN